MNYYPNNKPVVTAGMSDQRCRHCHKCEWQPGASLGKCELRIALAGSDSGEVRNGVDKACEHWTRRLTA